MFNNFIKNCCVKKSALWKLKRLQVIVLIDIIRTILKRASRGNSFTLMNFILNVKYLFTLGLLGYRFLEIIKSRQADVLLELENEMLIRKDKRLLIEQRLTSSSQN